MSRPTTPAPVKLIVSIIYSTDQIIPSVLRDLESGYGAIDFLSEPLSFHYTNYYAEEMGRGINRYILAFKRLIEPGQLPAIKVSTNELESRYSDPRGNRLINIDPGLLSMGNLILATGKYSAHRIYLGNGIFGDLTLIYRSKSFRPLEWTYADYCSSGMIKLLNCLRKRYLFQIKE